MDFARLFSRFEGLDFGASGPQYSAVSKRHMLHVIMSAISPVSIRPVNVSR